MDIWQLIIPIAFLPVFFAMGWFAARIDMKAVLKQAKSIPTGFFSSLDALAENNTGKAVQDLADIAQQQQGAFELNLTLGKLYRQRGENNKAIVLHQKLLQSPDLSENQREQVLYELGLNYQNAGLVDRAEQIFISLQNGNAAQKANEILLNIYQQDRDWHKAIEMAKLLAHDAQSYQFEIAQFHCEIAQTALFRSDFETARQHVALALDSNKKCTRANMILGDIEQKMGALSDDNQEKTQHYQSAINAYSAIEKQNFAYLTMVGEKLYDAYDALGAAEKGLEVLIGYSRTFVQLDLINVIYEKSLLLWGEQKANQLAIELVRTKPDLNGVYRLLGLQLSDLNPAWKSDVDMMRNVIGRQLQKSVSYRCRHCHFRSQAFFWLCPACNKWETFTPNKIEI